MDRNNIIGLVLIFAIFAGSFYLIKPNEQEVQKEQRLQDSLKAVKEGRIFQDTIAAAKPAEVLDSAALAKPFGATKVGQEQTVALENDVLKIEISTKGGKVKSVQLKGETNFDGSPLYLLEGDNNKFGFLFNAAGQHINTNDLFFTVSNNTTNAATLRLNYSADQYIEYNYTLENSHNIHRAHKDLMFPGQCLCKGQTFEWLL